MPSILPSLLTRAQRPGIEGFTTGRDPAMVAAVKLALVASSGGHLAELFALQAFWRVHPHFWVSFETSDAVCMLADESVYWAHFPTNRSIKNLVRNWFLARRILREERPDLIISTGAGVAVPFLLLGRWMGIKTIYIESLTRISELSLSGYMVYPFVDGFWVQWEELAHRYRRAQFHGRVI